MVDAIADAVRADAADVWGRMSGRPGAAQISLTRPTVEMIDRLCLLMGQSRQEVIYAAVALLMQKAADDPRREPRA